MDLERNQIDELVHSLEQAGDRERWFKGAGDRYACGRCVLTGGSAVQQSGPWYPVPPLNAKGKACYRCGCEYQGTGEGWPPGWK